MMAGLPKEVVEYIINPEETCSECGAPLKIIGKEIARTEVEYQPTKLIVKQNIRQVAKCTKCGTASRHALRCENGGLEGAAIAAGVYHKIKNDTLRLFLNRLQHNKGVIL